ncbi:MAG TPA: EpsI family protein [Burkholderiaceae bacterium]|nr:EpsI family protein [Burkholderiaceae bacterium]
MNGLRWRALVVALLMLAGSAAAVLAKPTKSLADQIGIPNLDAMLPKQFGEWRVDTNMPTILPSPDVQAQLDKIYNQVLSRTYVNKSGQRIMLSVAYGGDQSDGTSAHRPEVCYPAQGFAITSNQLTTLYVGGRELPARRLMSKLGQRNEPITYWVVVGDEVVTTGIGQKLAQMRYGLHGVIADGMLVRISSIDADMERGHKLQEQFASDLFSHIDHAAAARLFGNDTR